MLIWERHYDALDWRLDPQNSATIWKRSTAASACQDGTSRAQRVRREWQDARARARCGEAVTVNEAVQPTRDWLSRRLAFKRQDAWLSRRAPRYGLLAHGPLSAGLPSHVSHSPGSLTATLCSQEVFSASGSIHTAGGLCVERAGAAPVCV